MASRDPAFPSREGKSVPDAKFVCREDNDFKIYSTDDIFKGKTVVVFCLPGAFTPTCSSTHVPGYESLQPLFKKNGVDDIFCVSVNDGFVMEQWKKDQKASRVRFLADGNQSFSSGMGSLADFTHLGFGKRSLRYSMLVKDGKIEKMFIEPTATQTDPDPFHVSDAQTMLNYINPKEKPPKNILVFSKPGCPWCSKARDLLDKKGWPFTELTVGTNKVPIDVLSAVSQDRPTTPQIFINGEYCGGYEGLEKYVKAHPA